MFIITGASGGIGSYLRKEFLSKKEEVIGLYNNTTPIQLDSMYKVDISDAIEVKTFVENTKDKLNQIILINCAGSNYDAFAHKADPTKWARLISINLIGTFNIINALLPIMRQQGYGRIINMSSIVAQKAIAGTSAYAASKAGLWGMTKAIAVENASKNITINNINLGYFDIGMIHAVPEPMQQSIKESIPFKKFGDPSDIFKTVKYLIDCDYITGTSVDVNGGLF
jgi:NAD(P)-dependent dehydrogenase (short-subunit alcohol dehydrogenase family)